jgi:hypothetical protein
MTPLARDLDDDGEPFVWDEDRRAHRLVTDKPERLSMKVLVALCDILDCTPADLIDPHAEPATRRKAAGQPGAAVVELKPDLRPERARILDPE